VLTVPTDVTDADQVEALAQAAVDRFGRIDVWVNDAGPSRAATRRMLAAGGSGVIVNVSSISGRLPTPWAASYTAAKHGVAGFTDALRAELPVRSSIAVCAVYPAFTDTPT
jgi:NAD(P)-dependent dehydrogenase (short-subunit alcohol dehydrogenase family)